MFRIRTVTFVQINSDLVPEQFEAILIERHCWNIFVILVTHVFPGLAGDP